MLRSKLSTISSTDYMPSRIAYIYAQSILLSAMIHTNGHRPLRPVPFTARRIGSHVRTTANDDAAPSAPPANHIRLIDDPNNDLSVDALEHSISTTG